MAFVFDRGLAVPIWAIVFVTAALTAPPPATLFLMVVLGIAMIAFTIPALVPWLGASRSLAWIPSYRNRHKRSAATMVAAGACVRTVDEPNAVIRREANS